MISSKRIIQTVLALALICSAQEQPKAAHVKMYFPQVADGGPIEGRWQTTFRFVNLSSSGATVTIVFYTQGGSAWAVDLGSGLKEQHTVEVPTRGSRVVRSAATSATLRSGWAEVNSTQPIVGLASFTMIVNGRASQEVTTPTTQPTSLYDSYATGALGVAIANPLSSPVTVQAQAIDENGYDIGTSQEIQLPAKGHTQFNVRDKFPMDSSRSGWIRMNAKSPATDRFIAWTMNADPSGTFASLPDGGQKYPQVQDDRIALTFARLIDATGGMFPKGAPKLVVTIDPFVFATSGNKTVTVSVAAAELLNDSDDELAALLAHQMAHIIQAQVNNASIFGTEPDLDADGWSVVLLPMSGYDPYAIAGMHGKLHQATFNNASQTQVEGKSVADEHQSVHARMEMFMDTVNRVCTFDADIKAVCSKFKKIYHPSLPGIGPMSVQRPELNPIRGALRRVAERRSELR